MQKFDQEQLDEWREMLVAKQMKDRLLKEILQREKDIANQVLTEVPLTTEEGRISLRVDIRTMARTRDLLFNMFETSADALGEYIPGAEQTEPEAAADPFDIKLTEQY